MTGDAFKINHSLNCDDKCLMYLLTANSVTSNTRVKLQTSFVIDGTTIKIMLERLTGKSLVCRNSWHKSVLNEASVTFIDKTDGRDPKKEKDIACKH